MNRNALIASLVSLLLTAACFAQDGGPGGPGGLGGQGGQGPGGGPPPNFDPQAMRQRMMDRMRERLGASDDEWKVLQPKIEKVMSAQRDLRTGGGPGGPGMGPGGPPRGGDGGANGGGEREGRGGPRGGGGDDRGGPGGPPPQQGGPGGPPQDQSGPGRPGGPPPQDQQQASAIAQARQDLREAVDDANANPADLAKLVKTYRDARDKAKDDLAKAQKDLKDVVTPRQEAFFVAMGFLD